MNTRDIENMSATVSACY